MEDQPIINEKIRQLRKSLGESEFGDVLVVGGGISGIQASLDLADSGFRVYLIDKLPAIMKSGIMKKLIDILQSLIIPVTYQKVR